LSHVAIVSCAKARPLDDDLPSIQAAFAALRHTTTVVDWDDRSFDWAGVDVALIRSPWDYPFRHQEFLDWAAAVEQHTRLVHPARVLAWNTDKRYLTDLAAAGVEVVPTSFIDPGAAFDFPDGGYVVKPTVSAGSKDTGRFAAGEDDRAAALVRRIQGSGRTAMVQPYLDAVDRDGEAALIYFGGRLSHAITKGQMLELGVEPSEDLFQAEQIAARHATADEARFGQTVMDALPLVADVGSLIDPPTYARIDLLRDSDGHLRLLELELTEPGFFFETTPDPVVSATRLVEALFA
jgi:hypothetical protein